jgi:hypothetical protein
LFLAVDGGVSAQEVDGLFLLILRPLFELVHELAEREVDLLGEVGNRNIHRKLLHPISTHIAKLSYTNILQYSHTVIISLSPHVSISAIT